MELMLRSPGELSKRSSPRMSKTLKLEDIKTEEELYYLTSRITRFLPYEEKTAVEQGVCPLPTKCPEVATCIKEVCNKSD